MQERGKARRQTSPFFPEVLKKSKLKRMKGEITPKIVSCCLMPMLKSKV
jgi:hypothetical protein